MKLEYQTTDKDYIDFYEFNARNTPQGRKAMLTQKIAVPVILALVILCTMAFGVGRIFILVQLVLYAIFSWMWAKYLDKTIRKTAQSTLQKLAKKDQKPYSPQGIMDFNEKEITDQREKQTLTLHYSDVSSVYENGKAVYLYMSEANRIVLLPASALQAEETRRSLMEILKSKIAPEKFITT